MIIARNNNLKISLIIIISFFFRYLKDNRMDNIALTTEEITIDKKIFQNSDSTKR